MKKREFNKYIDQILKDFIPDNIFTDQGKRQLFLHALNHSNFVDVLMGTVRKEIHGLKQKMFSIGT